MKKSELVFENIIIEYKNIIETVIRKYNIRQILNYQRALTEEDLWSLGNIGLWNAYKNFDKKNGKFKAYAYYKVRSAILDELRLVTKYRTKWYKEFYSRDDHLPLYISINGNKLNYADSFIDEKISNEEKYTFREEAESYLKFLEPDKQKILVDRFIYGISVYKIAKKRKLSPSSISIMTKSSLKFIREKIRLKKKGTFSLIDIDYSLSKPIKSLKLFKNKRNRS